MNKRKNIIAIFHLLFAGLFSNLTQAQSKLSLPDSTQEATTPKHYATISGVVMDNNKEPIISAAVIVNQGRTPIAGTTTDINGNFKIDSLTPGTYTIKATYLGFKADTINNVKAYPEQPAQVTIVLQPDHSIIIDPCFSYKVPLVDSFDPDKKTFLSGEIEHSGH